MQFQQIFYRISTNILCNFNKYFVAFQQIFYRISTKNFNQAQNNSTISSTQQASNQNNETINDINSIEKNQNEILMKTTEISKLQTLSDSQQRKINQIEQENSRLKDELIKLKAKKLKNFHIKKRKIFHNK